MKRGFPKIHRSVLTGEAGVNLVARSVTNNLKWLFRRTHNEHDFGIDGYIDIATTDGHVTGRSLALQIKHGRSYTSRRDAHGYHFYGDPKHINYLLNQPLPVLLVIADPKSEACFWEHVQQDTIELTNKAWKMHVPFENRLDSASRGALERLAGPALDHVAELDEYWQVKNAMIASDFHIFPITRENIKSRHCDPLLEFFERLQMTKAVARRSQGKVELLIEGYDDDPRELWEIPEVVAWFKAVEARVKYWFYFLRADTDSPSLPLLTYCVCEVRPVPELREGPSANPPVEFDPPVLEGFLLRNFQWLNELAERLGLSEEENKRISQAIFARLGFGALTEDEE